MDWSDIDFEPPTEEEIDELMAEIEERKEQWDPLDLPESQAQLVRDLNAAGAPDSLISKTAAGAYHDYVSPFPMPKHQLIMDAQAHDLDEIAQRAQQGHYDDSINE